MHGNHIRLHLADNTPAHSDQSQRLLRDIRIEESTMKIYDEARTPRYKLRNGMLSNRHHRNWFVGGQPVGLVVSARVVAHIVEVAEKERHCVEFGHTRASTSWVFRMDFYPLIASPYQGPDGGTSRCPQCKGGSSHPTSWSLQAHTRGWRKTDCA